jgi:hypothetical protein
MKDRVVQYPNRFQLAAVAGQPNVYDITAVPGTITEAGTPIGKANLLTDATATSLGLSGANAIPDKAFQKLQAFPGYKHATFTANGTFTVPEGVYSVMLLGCAAGGNAIDAAVSRAKAGEAALYRKFNVTPGQVITVTTGPGNTIFGELMTLASASLEYDANMRWGGVSLGVAGNTTGSSFGPVELPVMTARQAFQVNGCLELSNLTFLAKGAGVSSGGYSTNNYPGWGGFFGLGGDVYSYTGSMNGAAGGFGAGGAGHSGGSAGAGSAGSPGFLVVMYKEGQ